jgi:hypothetical protein
MGLGMVAQFISLVLALLAVLSVFIYIPFISDYAFWVVIAAYLIVASAVVIRRMFFSVALVIALIAVVGVFIEIPFVSNYAFWIAIAAYIIIISTTELIK